MTVVDPYTIRFKTAAPYPLMPSDMTQVAIISKSAAKASTDDFNSGKSAIGTGPYKLVRYAKSDRIELARNDAYWGGKTPWDKVTLRLLPQDAARVAALLSGDAIQVIENCRPRMWRSCARTSGSPSIEPSPIASSTCTWIAIATSRLSSPTKRGSRLRRIR